MEKNSELKQRILGSKKTSLAGAVGLLTLLADQQDSEFFKQLLLYVQQMDPHTVTIAVLAVLLFLAHDGPILDSKSKNSAPTWPQKEEKK